MNQRRDFIKQMSLASAAFIAKPGFANSSFFISDCMSSKKVDSLVVEVFVV